MGDLRGRRARWTAAAVMAPVAAAVFAGTTAWANSHDPNAAVTPAAVQPKPTHTVDPVLRKLRKQVKLQTREVANMQRNVKALHKRAKAIANAPVSSGSSSTYTYTSGGSTTYSSGSSGSSSGSSAGSSGGSSGGSGGTTTAPAPPPPPPPPHTSTGASSPP